MQFRLLAIAAVWVAASSAWALTSEEENNVAIYRRLNAGVVNMGCGALTNVNGSDIVLAKFSPSGSCLWAKEFGSSNIANGELGSAVVTDGSGNVMLTGAIISDVDFGGGPLFGNFTYDIFAAKFSAAGAHLWSHRFSGSWDDYGRAIAADSTGDVLLAGSFNEDVNFGGGVRTGLGGNKAFGAKFGP